MVNMINFPFYNKKNSIASSEGFSIRLIPLGGVGNVTKNMYLYELRQNGLIKDILIVDCGIGFPDEEMFGVDLIIPDITYLKDKLEKIRAIVITHGHDDHLAALPYILPRLGNVPIFATKLTAAFINVKLSESGLQSNLKAVDFDEIISLGPFSVEFVRVTHSVPDAANLIIKTPVGIFYHGSDYKFDWTPLDGKRTEVGKIARAGEEGILCLLSDCVRIESPGYTLSEKIIEDTLIKEIQKCKGQFIFTTQSSNISRIQQAVSVSVKNNRKIAFLGRSIQKNTKVADELGYLEINPNYLIKEEEIKSVPPHELTLIVAGSQAQTNSALVRIAGGDHKFARLTGKDSVVFSADPIPGYENSVHNLIDSLTAQGASVSYSEVTDNLHVSGHGSINDIMLMISLAKAKYMMPIGGTQRHMKKFKDTALEMGYPDNKILIPKDGEIIEFSKSGQVQINDRIELKNIMVDGLGIGDVGNVVLRDRQTMANEGVLIVIVPINENTGQISGEPDIISRGFVYVKESSELIEEAKKLVISSLKSGKDRIIDWHYVKKGLEDKLEKYLWKKTKRRPLVLTVVIRV